jgi:voltage-gated potassium channel
MTNKQPLLESVRQKREWQRTLRAELRDVRLLLNESRVPLLLFVSMITAGTLLFLFFYIDPESGQRPGFGESLYASFSLLFFNPHFGFPSLWYLQILYFLIPILGLAAVADGVLRFGTAVVSKTDRGQKWQVAMASTYSNHVIVCGMGRVGYRVSVELLRFGRQVVAIEPNAEGRFVEKAKALGIPVIIDDARRSSNLIKAGVDRADAIVPCTDDELANLDIALDSREINPGIKVVMRMFDADLARRVERGFGIHSLSASALAAPIFAAAAMRFNVKHSFYVGDMLLSLSEVNLEPGSDLVGWSVGDLQSKLGLTVVYHQTASGPALNPAADVRLEPEAEIFVMASFEALQRLDELNQPAQSSAPSTVRRGKG